VLVVLDVGPRFTIDINKVIDLRWLAFPPPRDRRSRPMGTIRRLREMSAMVRRPP
jgi:hypothetical protein